MPSNAPVLPLTSIRFFAAFYVVLLHSVLWSHRVDTSTWIGRFLRTGYTAVGFFFVLSGYILAHVYLNTGRPFDARKFLIARFARAYPLLLASLLLDAPNVLLLRVHLLGIRAALVKMPFLLVAESALLQSWSGHFRTINPPSWSLSAEAFFYLAFPVCALGIWRRKGLNAAWMMLLFWACAMLVPVLVTVRYPALFVENDASTLQWSIELMPIFRIFEFFAGISLCALQQLIAVRLPEARRGRFGYMSLAAASLLFLVAIQFANHVPLLVMSNGFLLPVWALLILGLVNIGTTGFGSTDVGSTNLGPANGRGWLASVLSHRYLVVLGEASYAIYLLHDPLWTYFSRVHAIDSLAIWLVYLAVLLAISIASFFFLERPARRFILARAAVRPRVLQEQESVAAD